MSYYAKTMLTCYPIINSVVSQIDNLIKKRVRNSFYDFSPTFSQAEKILSLRGVKDDLMELKEIVDYILNSIDSEDATLIKYKYFKILPKGEFDHTSRNYFRKQNKAILKFVKKLNFNGYTENWFNDKYLKISFIVSCYNKIVKEEGKKHSAL